MYSRYATRHLPVRLSFCCAVQYSLDRMDAEEDVEEEEDDMEINSNMLMNLPRDHRQQLITADFFRQAMLAATVDNAGADSAPPPASVTQVTHPTYILVLRHHSYFVA